MVVRKAFNIGGHQMMILMTKIRSNRRTLVMQEQYGLDPTHEDIVMVDLYDLDNPIRIVLLFLNATLDGCKESHCYWRASDDDADDRN
jgi:hypothetical protein